MEPQTTSISEQFNLEQAVDAEPIAIHELSVVRLGDTLICSGSVPMFMPPTAKHVRRLELRLPLFAEKPSVITTLYSPESIGTVFSVYTIKINRVNSQTQTQIVIAAVSPQGASELPFFCNVIVIGKAA